MSTQNYVLIATALEVVSSHHLGFLEIMTTTLDWLGWFKYKWDKQSKSTFYTLILRQYALVARKFKHLLTKKIRKSTTCIFSCDFLAIYDGSSSTSSMMGKYCGVLIPPSHISSSNKILVYLSTNSYNGYHNGFKLLYNPTSNYIINSGIIWNQF